MFVFHLCQEYLDDVNELLCLEFGIEIDFMTKQFLEVQTDQDALEINFETLEMNFVRVKDGPVNVVTPTSIVTTYNFYKSVIMMVMSELAQVNGVSYILTSFPVWGSLVVGQYSTYVKCPAMIYEMPHLTSNFILATFKKIYDDDPIFETGDILKFILYDGIYFAPSMSAYELQRIN